MKNQVERARPLRYIPDIKLREGSGHGLGFISGHSAVAAAVVVMTMAAVPRRWHPLLALIAVLVGVAGLNVVDRWRLRHPQP